jgi:hypothetical protein
VVATPDNQHQVRATNIDLASSIEQRLLRKLDAELRGQTLIAEISNTIGSDGLVRMNWSDDLQEFQDVTQWLNSPLGSKL